MKLQIVSPIQSVQINSRQVRLFVSPLSMLDMPWHTISDLWQAEGFTPSFSMKIIQGLYAKPHKDIICRVPTQDGPMAIAPHWIALQTFDALIDRGLISAEDKKTYLHAIHESAFEIVRDRYPLRYDLWLSAVGEMVISSLSAEISALDQEEMF